MVVPGAAPTVLLYATVQRRQEATNPTLGTALFLAGYLAMWAAFSVLATLSQWGLDLAGAMRMDMSVASTVLGGAILIAAGLYQFTSLKAVCLRHCQSPVLFLSQHWRRGPAGAFRMGLRHGAYCLGCCWFLMALLFFAGVMNLIWIAGLAIYVALEKFLPLGPWLSRAAGAALVGLGVAVIAGMR
jgi:predicted metal-binding membrane protein